MADEFPSKSIDNEDARIALIWINSELDLEEVIDLYASKEYKDYYYAYKKRKERALLEEGRIID